MTVQIKKDGWEISGDSIQDLKLGIAAVQDVLNGEVGSGKRRPGRPRKRPTHDEIASQRLEKRKKAAVAYLKAIQGEPSGIAASALVIALGIKSTRAIGSAALVVNRTLAEAGFKPAVVYAWEKKVGHEKIWSPKPRIAEAITAVENLGK